MFFSIFVRDIAGNDKEEDLWSICIMINKQINQMNETLSRLKQFLKRPFLPTRAHYFGFGSCWLWDLRLSSFISVITF